MKPYDEIIKIERDAYLHERPVLQRLGVQKYSRQVAREVEVVLGSCLVPLLDDCMKNLDAVADPCKTFGQLKSVLVLAF